MLEIIQRGVYSLVRLLFRIYLSWGRSPWIGILRNTSVVLKWVYSVVLFILNPCGSDVSPHQRRPNDSWKDQSPPSPSFWVYVGLFSGYNFTSEVHLHLWSHVSSCVHWFCTWNSAAGHTTYTTSATRQGLEPWSLDSGPFLFPTAYAASQWTEHLQGAEMFILDSFLEKELLK